MPLIRKIKNLLEAGFTFGNDKAVKIPMNHNSISCWIHFSPAFPPGVVAGGVVAATDMLCEPFEETDWGDEDDDLELLNLTQGLLECNEINPVNEPDPWAATEANDAKNAIADRIESQDNRGELLQLRSKMKALEQQNQTILTENYAHKGEITLLRRELNKLATSRQLEMLNK